jgi:hypothetical protein
LRNGVLRDFFSQEWKFFMGYRFAIFDFATETLGGAILAASFELTSP